jgi:plastocyanin
MHRRRTWGPAALLAGVLTAAAAPTPAILLPFRAITPGTHASGQAQVHTTPAGLTVTVLALDGLTPGQAYTAHYHAQGADPAADPCQARGEVTLTFPRGRAGAAGRLTLQVTAPASRLTGTKGASIDVHADSAPATPLLCAVVRKPATTPPAAAAVVRLSANRFEPATLRVRVGTTVVWQQEDTALHNVISAELPTLRSSDLRRGDTYRHTFTQAGTFTYYCSYHAGMTGTVIVTD